MGLRFRKSFGSGPFRVNLSKSGVSYSIGTKGARVTKKAGGGIRTSVGTGGVYYTKDFGGGNVSRRRKAKKKGGCLPWLGGFIAVFAVIGLFGSCAPEEEAPEIQEEQPAIIEEQEPAAEPVVEEQPEEKEVIEFEPVFVDPFTGERSDEETTEPPTEETPVVDDPVVESVVEQPIEDAPVVETPGSVVETEPVPPPAVEPDPVAPSVVEPEPEPQGQIVYITNTGTKYHRAGCRHLDESCIEVSIDYATGKQMEPCKNCH